MLNRSSERIEYINLDSQKEQSIFDLSTSGICCLFNRRLADDSSVSIKIGDLQLKARVVYCQERMDGFRLGLQFVDVAGEQQKKLNDSVDKFSRGVALTCTIVDAPKSPS
jgi:c-di-GMP-binding flagellar brake protein YcgR